MKVRRKEGEMIIWTVSVWSQGGKKEVPFESPMRQADMASSSVTLTPSFSALHLPRFPLLSMCCCLRFVIFSSPSCFLLVWCCVLFYSVLLWSVFFSSTVLCLKLLFTVLLCCSQLNKRSMSSYWQLILCAQLRPRRVLSRRSFRNRNTELKVEADEYSTSKMAKCGFQS